MSLPNRKISWLIVISTVLLFNLSICACKKATPETLSEILDRAANVASFKYDCSVTWRDLSGTSRGEIVAKVWAKNNKMRVQLTTLERTVEEYLIDIDAHSMYIWYPPENVPAKIENAWEIPNFTSAKLWTISIAIGNPKIVGTETIDGKVCLVVEYFPGEVTGKAWLWKNYPFLVRTELVSAEGKTTIEFKNIEFGDIADSMFEMP